MRPRRLSPGGARNSHGVIHQLHASMRPRRLSPGGGLRGSTALANYPPGFNEAPATVTGEDEPDREVPARVDVASMRPRRLSPGGAVPRFLAQPASTGFNEAPATVTGES